MITHTRRSTKELLLRLLRDYISPYKRKMIYAVLCMGVVALMTASNAYMMKPVLDDIFINKDAQKLLWIPLVIVAISMVSAAANYGQTLFMRFVGQRIIADMQIALFSHLIKSDVQLFTDNASGRLISRFTNDIQMMRAAVSSTLTGFAKELVTMVALVAVMIYQSPQMATLVCLAFPLPLYFIFRLGKRMRKVSDGTQQQLGEFTAQLDDVFQGMRTVKAYTAEGFEAVRARTTIERLFKLYFKAIRIQVAAAPMMEIVSGLVIALVIGFGGSEVVRGENSPGEFFSFITAFIMAFRPLKALTGLSGTFQEGMAAANRLFDVLDTPTQVSDAPNAQPLALSQGEVKFENVTFQYGEGTGGVEHVSFTIPSGKTAALVGLSGGGKSTLMQLLMRFYDVQSGRITIDGQDIREVTLESVRGAMGFVPQETILFDDTVRANIAYGKRDATEAEIIQAAKAASADEFIRVLPEGYNTMIGASGIRLSGGQRQRLAIARAMLKNAPILLLDEATSALDNTSERAVQEALEALMQGRTTLVIAHRLSTIAHADVIYVVEAGSIVESGSHAELLAKGGAYANLYASHAASGVL
jgi:ATP-binding cassette, subfamily B, bacterial MsbA